MKRGRIEWSPVELEWIEANKTMFRTDAHAVFVEQFKRQDVSFANYAALCKRMGWLTGRLKGNGTKGRQRLYSATEMEFIAANSAMTRTEMADAFNSRFGRTDVTPGKIGALRKRFNLKTGRTGHFPKGHEPWTKGKKLPFNANSAATQFKTGQTPFNAQPVGHERLSDDGYVYIIIPETNPHTGYDRRRVHKHRWLWEQANGPVPDGMVLKCLDGDKANCDPSNWEMIPMAMLPRLNGRFGRGYDKAPSEIKPVIMTITRLEHKARTRRKPEGRV